MYFLSVLHADPFSKVHLSNFASFFILVLSFSFWLLPPLWNLLRPSTLFHLHFLTPPIHHLCPLLNPSAAALAHSQLRATSMRKNNNLPDLPKTCLVLEAAAFSAQSFKTDPERISSTCVHSRLVTAKKTVHLRLLGLHLLNRMSPLLQVSSGVHRDLNRAAA